MKNIIAKALIVLFTEFNGAITKPDLSDQKPDRDTKGNNCGRAARGN
jgi:hypothetical protein